MGNGVWIFLYNNPISTLWPAYANDTNFNEAKNSSLDNTSPSPDVLFQISLKKKIN